MRLIELLKSGTFRLAVLFALAVTLSTSVVFLFIYWQVAAFDVKHLEIRVADGVARAATESDDRLRQALDLRLAKRFTCYRLRDAAIFDANGKWVNGNIAALPENLPIDGTSHAVEAQLAGSPDV